MEELVERIKDQVGQFKRFSLTGKQCRTSLLTITQPVVVAQILVPAMDRVAQLCLDAIGNTHAVPE